jgi:L-ascorbate metabolism protein UlaG (beta-lactamase superfamily)
MFRSILAALALLGSLAVAAQAQDAQRSECLAMANAPPRATPASLRRVAKADEVDPKIPHVLHGWGDDGKPAHHALRVGDVFIRNVTTDIRRYYGDYSGEEMIKDGNSIFIFEVAGLCIGHLGHLHHKLDESHFAAIGRLDILMVPIDGTYTMSLSGVSDITRRLRAAVVLPMHRFATPLDEFMRLIGQQFEIDRRSERTLKISRDTLPSAPTVIILEGV